MLTEAQKRQELLRYFADENDQQIFPPAPRRNETRCRQLVRDGLLKFAGISVMWGPLYAITDAGRRELPQSRRAQAMSKRGATEHWFVVYPDGQPSLQTVSYGRRNAIKYWLGIAGKDWRHWYRYGMRVRRVKIKWQVIP